MIVVWLMGELRIGKVIVQLKIMSYGDMGIDTGKFIPLFGGAQRKDQSPPLAMAIIFECLIGVSYSSYSYPGGSFIRSV